ncbi:MAG TPA: alkaline phosphatase family protein [Balneolales bacterium]|nr:alkaline phosphatase family protein [Balneolales bacterium]
MKKLLLLFVFACFLFFNAQAQDKLPRPDHVIIVMEENHSFDQIMGNKNAPYINQLAGEGALFTDAHGVTHPSQPNYLAIYAGSIHGVTDDHCLKSVTPFHTMNLGWALIHAGYSFAGYSDAMKETGDPGCGYGKSKFEGGSPLYARKHNPWVDWMGTGEHNIPATTNQPLFRMPVDYSKLPTVSFVMPDEDHDMHNGTRSAGGITTIKEGDLWLEHHLGPYVKWAMKHNSLLIVTYDEDNGTPKNRIPTIFVGPMVKAGKYSMEINHYNVLRTIEAMYRLEKSGPAKAAVISSIWK